MIHLTRTGDLGLDVLLGGGWRLVTRLPEQSSTMILIRGGAGAGKTLLGLEVALSLAHELGGDVVVGCVELLPTEYQAQIHSARPDIESSKMVVLPDEPIKDAPNIFCALLTDLDPDEPDLVASLETLRHDVENAGGSPRVFIVDSLSDGYGLGSSTPRTSADAVMKFAARDGRGLILCEETEGDKPSPWLFSADIVMELGVDSRERGRWIEVRKHRFGPSVSGRHELEIGGGPPQVFPEPHAWVTRHSGTIFKQRNEDAADHAEVPRLRWASSLANLKKRDSLDPPMASRLQHEGRFTLITSGDPGLSRTLALGLLPVKDEGRDLLVEIDPLSTHPEEHNENCFDRFLLPTLHGPARALRWIIERVANHLRSHTIRRLVFGDLGGVLGGNHALRWAETIRVFVSLVHQSNRGIPLIGYSGFNLGDEATAARSLLSFYSDLRISAGRSKNQIDVLATERWKRQLIRFSWPAHLDRVPLPEGLEAADHPPSTSSHRP